MTTDTPTLTFKAQSFYVACAPQQGIWSYGKCFEEAANGLAEQLHSIAPRQKQGTGKDENSHAVI